MAEVVEPRKLDMVINIKFKKYLYHILTGNQCIRQVAQGGAAMLKIQNALRFAHHVM